MRQSHVRGHKFSTFCRFSKLLIRTYAFLGLFLLASKEVSHTKDRLRNRVNVLLEFSVTNKALYLIKDPFMVF